MTRILRLHLLVVGTFVSLASAGRAQARGGHTHPAPHGGEVVEFADNHVEFKADSSGAIMVWLLDSHEKTIAPPRSGSVTLIPEGQGQSTVPLHVNAASQALVGRFDPARFPAFQAVVSLPIAGKRHNFRFHYPAHH